MRRILVEQARQKKHLKRGSGMQRHDLEILQPAVEPACDILAVDEALERLEREQPTKAELDLKPANSKRQLFRRA